jgi:uncharacterized protein
MSEQRNVLGGPLAVCGANPMTGFSRSGCCETSRLDHGSHTVCARLTEEFLEFSKEQGNDLSTPIPAHDFPGLKPGDRWCLCAARWQEALDAGVAPKVVLAATNQLALEVLSLDDLRAHAIEVMLPD